jgi:hypothetical protein
MLKAENLLLVSSQISQVEHVDKFILQPILPDDYFNNHQPHVSKKHFKLTIIFLCFLNAHINVFTC